MNDRVSRGRFGEHEESTKTEALRDDLPEEDAAAQMALLAGGFADPNRVRLLCALESGAICVGDLALVLGMSQSAVSHQLRLLKSLGLVRGSRTGKHIYYELSWPGSSEVLETLRRHSSG